MSLRLPRFALERRLRACPALATTAFALSVRDGARERVVAATAPARAAGVREGAALAAARACCAGLQVARADRGADQRALARLAVALLRFTPDVCREDVGLEEGMAVGRAALLLEVGRTAFHFGGEEALAQQVVAACARAGHAAQLAVADTPEAARTLARAGELAGDATPRHAPDGAREPAAARALFAALPWQALAPSSEVATACRALGVTTLGELLALPRAGLATRTSLEFVAQLQRLQGELEEPLVRIVAPELLEEEIELPAPVRDLDALLFACVPLLEALCGELERRSAALAAATFSFVPAQRGPPTLLPLAPATPTRDAALLRLLLAHRLERTALPGWIDAVQLRVTQSVACAAEQGPLFAGQRDREAERAGAALADRLAVRLGRERVQAAQLLADPRPERAFRWSALGASDGAAASGGGARAASGVAAAAGARPLALLDPPQPCAIECDARGAPCCEGRGEGRSEGRELRVVRGPERIAGGWWDGGDVERDYYEVEAPDGERRWLFRDRCDGRWYCHGTFH
ncbi:MAG: hypothetical protein JNL90_13690 [Planctomycetes bacterium]|nr:hypothetical protein [Planctomycetota bacterium]